MDPKDFVKLTWQDGTVPEVGVNGCQVNDVLDVVIERLRELNKAFPCRENSISITKLEEAVMWQNARTQNRVAQGVEGQHKPHAE
jgi:hypothetical protein